MPRLDVLAIAAHPDDVELCAGGTLIRMADHGLRTGIFDLTRGEMGTRGDAETRLAEACAAADVLGLTWRGNGGLPDNGLTNTPEHREVIVRVIRETRPRVVFINAPSDRHPDHGHAATLTLDALFYSGLAKLETGQEPWRPKHVFHYMQDRPVFEPTLVMDISDVVERKNKAILAFSSQFLAKPGDGPQTHISSERFFKFIEGRSRHYGHMIGVEFGEPFLHVGGPLPMDFSLFQKQ
jgi:bacillithiol biosynthesis deacetylase BshB1